MIPRPYDQQMSNAGSWNPSAQRKLVLWRHGRTDWNLNNRFQGALDIDLDEVGIAQAAAAANVLSSMAPTAIVSSDLSRARRTAQALATRVGLGVTTDERLRETNGGQWQGLTRPEILERDPELLNAWVAGHDVRPPGGETRGEVAERMMAAIDDHLTSIPRGGTLVIVSHGGALRGAIGSLMRLLPHQWTALGVLSNCSWSVLVEAELPPAHAGAAGETVWRLSEYNAGSPPEPALGADDR